MKQRRGLPAVPRNHCAAPPDPSVRRFRRVSTGAVSRRTQRTPSVPRRPCCGRMPGRRAAIRPVPPRQAQCGSGAWNWPCLLPFLGGCARCYCTRRPITGNAADHLVRNRQKPRLTCRNARQEISADWPKSRRFVAGRVVPVTPPAAPRSQAPQHVPDPPGEGRRQLADTPRPAVHRHPLTAPPSASRADTNNPAAPAPMPTARRAADHQSHSAGTGISSRQRSSLVGERQQASGRSSARCAEVVAAPRMRRFLAPHTVSAPADIRSHESPTPRAPTMAHRGRD